MDNLIKLKTFTYPHEAQMMKMLLESAGIDVMIKDEMMVQMFNFSSNAVGGVKLYIHESDLVEAREVLRDAGYIKDEQEKKIIEVFREFRLKNPGKCPYCGSDNIDKAKAMTVWHLLAWLLFSTWFPLFGRINKCYDCHREWKIRK